MRRLLGKINRQPESGPAVSREALMRGEASPEAMARFLASKKGWIDIDRHVLTKPHVLTKNLTWIPCPPLFPKGEDRESWALDQARVRWRFCAAPHRKRDVRDLAEILSAIHKDIYAAGRCHTAVIHLPDPRMLPVPVQLGVWAMHGERDEMLRMLVQAVAPEAIEPPQVEEFTTERLGTGLKALHYQRREEDPTLAAFLNYAWRSERYETDLRLFAFSRDIDRMEEAIPDIEELARAISIVPWPPK